MTEYLIVGDVHGDLAFTSKMNALAKTNGIATILQVGDFGIWDHTDEGVNFLDALNDEAWHFGVQWVFVPGNHENYDRLEWYEQSNYRTHEGFVKIRDNILYTGKINKWVWDGVVFKAVGGAHSIDKEWRTPGKSWWPQETLTAGELLTAQVMGPADVLLTHDCPTYAPFNHLLKNDPDSHIHRQKMNDVVENTKAKVHFHGHMHDWYDYENPFGGKVYGLECNDAAMWGGGKPKNHVILNIFEDGDDVWYDVNTKPYFKETHGTPQ